MGAELLLKELRDQFFRFTDSSSIRFEPVFIVVTALDLRYKYLLREDHKKSGK